MGFFHFLNEFRTMFVRVFAENRQRSLVLACGQNFVINVVFLQRSGVRLGKFCGDTNRTDDRERRCNDLVGDDRHHVPTTCCNLVDCNSEFDSCFSYSKQLRSSKSITMNVAASTL